MARLTETDWERAAWKRLAQEGIDGVRVEALARDLGVTKGSFYWHFADREALLRSLLEDWERRGTERIIAAVDAVSDEPPADRVRSLTGAVFGRPDKDVFEVGIRMWSRSHHGAREVLRRVDARRVGYVAQLLEDAGIDKDRAQLRADVIYRALIGDFTLNTSGAGRMSRGAVAELIELALTGASK